MRNSTYYLSLLFLACFVVMLIYIFTQFSPHIAFWGLSFVFLAGAIYLVICLKKDKNTNHNANNNRYLPFLLRRSKFLRIVFASLALTVIISALSLPLFLFFFDINTIVGYIENYFEYHILMLSVLVLPFVIKYLRD